MAMIQIQKLNVIKEIDERELQEFEKKGYKKVGEVVKKKAKVDNKTAVDGKENSLFQ